MTYSQFSQSAGNYFLETHDRLKPSRITAVILGLIPLFKLKPVALSANENFFPSGNTYKNAHKLNMPTYLILGLERLLG